MAFCLSDDLDLIDLDWSEFDDYPEQRHREESEEEDHILEVESYTSGTSAAEYRNGKDIQGIHWGSLNFSRDDYRKLRLSGYKNYENIPRSEGEIEKKCQMVESGQTFYDFQFNTRLVKPTIVHFQLRNLIWATSKHDVYTLQNYSIMHWSSLTRKASEVLSVAGPVVPKLKHCGSLPHSLNRVQITSMAVRENLLVAGGFQGELVCKYLNQPGVVFSTTLTPEDRAITNGVDIYQTSLGSLRVSSANNDCCVRTFDPENFTLLSLLSFSWSVNNTSVSPDGKLLAVLGDSTECLLVDEQSGKVIGSLTGHLDYSFASAWHPEGRILATGSQDKTCRLWDVRKMTESVAVLKGRMRAIRSIKFSEDGHFMALAEGADFIHIHDVNAGYRKSQEIDLFGGISGLSFSPDSEALFIGIADHTYGSLVELRKRHPCQYLDSFI